MALSARLARPPARLCRTYSASASALNHCVALVRSHDRERYLCLLAAPPSARAALVALFSLNLETARVRESVTEPAIGRMRLSWWRQSVRTALEGAPPDHPVAQALAHAHHRVGFTRRFVEQILDAREADLERMQPEDLGRSERLVGACGEGLGDRVSTCRIYLSSRMGTCSGEDLP